MCQDDPEFPAFITNKDDHTNANFTTVYEADIGIISKEVGKKDDEKRGNIFIPFSFSSLTR